MIVDPPMIPPNGFVEDPERGVVRHPSHGSPKVLRPLVTRWHRMQIARRPYRVDGKLWRKRSARRQMGLAL